MSSVLQAGSTVSHYRIVSRLGAGGMGEVYKAQDTKLDRTVALKILPPEVVENEDRVRRFVQEAKAASGLSHPHIVAIHEIGEEAGDAKAGLHYIAMEFVNGVTLRGKIYDGNTNLKDLLRYLAQAADGLANAHAAGIIHRDLKPDNIMVTQDGYAKVLDFGLAKLTERAPLSDRSASTAVMQQTREGVVVGTVGYMSPEQVKGSTVDHRSDIFSFGCILYEAATKRKPFTADSDVDALHKIIHDDPQSISEINPAIPAELGRMIRRCLAKDPGRRYHSMKDLAIELSDLSQEFETLTPSGSSTAPSLILPRPRWPTPVIVAVTVMVLAIGAFFLTRQFRDASKTRVPAGQASFTQLTDYAGIESSPRFSPDGTFVVYVRGQSQNRDIYMQRIGGRKPINLTDAPQDDYQPAISPDGQLIAFRSERQGGGIFIMGATGESVKRLADLGFDPAWSPDGKDLVVATEGVEQPLNRGAVSQLWRIRYPSGERTLISQGDAVQPAWSPHGYRIAYWARPSGSSQRDIWTIPAAGGEPVRVTNDPAVDWNPVWSPDGNYLYFSSDRAGSMNLWRIAIDERTGTTRGGPEAITTPARWAGPMDVSRDGGRIVFTALDDQNRVQKVEFDPVAEKIVGKPRPITGGIRIAAGADISPDGAWLTFWSPGIREGIYLARTDGTEERKLTDDNARDRTPRWSADGKQIAFQSDRSGRYEIWTANPESGELRQVTLTTGHNVASPMWSPDGRRMIASNQFGAYFVNLTDPLPVQKLEPLPPLGQNETFWPRAWSPDGQWIMGLRRSKNGSTEPGIIIYSMVKRTYDELAKRGREGAWFNDSRRILLRHESQFFVLDRMSKKMQQISNFDPPYPGGLCTLSADNRTLLFNSRTLEADIWMLTMK